MSTVGILVIVVTTTLFLLLPKLEIKMYHVGDNFGWTVPPISNFYLHWALQYNFFVGDRLGTYTSLAINKQVIENLDLDILLLV